MSGTLATVVRLHQATNLLRETEARLADVPEWMRELHAEHEERKGEIDALEAETEEAGRLHRAAQAQAADGEVLLKRYQEQIGAVRTQREYSALLQEIDTAKELIRQAEAAAAGATERESEATRRLEEARAAFTDLASRYDEALAKWEEEKPTAQAEAERLQGEIETLRERVTPQVLGVYDRIGERYGETPLATVRRVERPRGASIYSCSACNYRVRPQAVVTLQRLTAEQPQGGELVLCDGCRRILYFDETGA
ncbi:MAG: zinc ribbon domain-containing protein [Thermoanaerobaculia bacterium]